MPQGAGFISSVTGYVDCQAQVLGSGAWASLSAPGSTLMVVLTGFLTIFIALIGYNLLLGMTMTVRSVTLAFVKIGAVFALATSWPAYRTLVYQVVVDGPAQLVSEVGPQAQVVRSDATLLERLDLADRAMAQLAILGPGNPSPAEYDQIPPPPFAGFDAFAIGGARITFLSTAIGGLAIVRVIAGLMLGLGPFFIAFLMFDSTRGLFEGWIRELAGAALGSLGASIALGHELALNEPWLNDVVTRRMAGETLPTMPTELFVLALLFAMLVLATLYACARVARGFRLPWAVKTEHVRSGPRDYGRQAAASDQPRTYRQTKQAERTRAAAVASILSDAGRRDTALTLSVAGRSSLGSDGHSSGGDVGRSPMPVGRSFSRRSTARVSARAAKRDVGQ
jgi:type IV secretion system protein VirB6